MLWPQQLSLCQFLVVLYFFFYDTCCAKVSYQKFIKFVGVFHSDATSYKHIPLCMCISLHQLLVSRYFMTFSSSSFSFALTHAIVMNAIRCQIIFGILHCRSSFLSLDMPSFWFTKDCLTLVTSFSAVCCKHSLNPVKMISFHVFSMSFLTILLVSVIHVELGLLGSWIALDLDVSNWAGHPKSLMANYHEADTATEVGRLY